MDDDEVRGRPVRALSDMEFDQPGTTDLGVEVLDRAEAAAVRLQMMVPTGRLDACSRWATGGGVTYVNACTDVYRGE